MVTELVCSWKLDIFCLHYTKFFLVCQVSVSSKTVLHLHRSTFNYRKQDMLKLKRTEHAHSQNFCCLTWVWLAFCLAFFSGFPLPCAFLVICSTKVQNPIRKIRFSTSYLRRKYLDTPHT